MTDKVEYEVVDIQPLKDGHRFKVVIKSDFNIDVFGEKKNEYFTFPLSYLKDDRWKKVINQVMLERAKHRDEKNKQGLTDLNKIKQKIEEVKSNHLGKVDLTKEYLIVKGDESNES